MNDEIPMCLTANAMTDAIESAETLRKALMILTSELASFGYTKAAEIFWDRFGDEID